MWIYHSDSIVDQGLPKDHVVKVRIHPNLRRGRGRRRDLVTSEKMARTATGSTAEMMLVKVNTWWKVKALQVCLSLTSTGFRVLFDTY